MEQKLDLPMRHVTALIHPMHLSSNETILQRIGGEYVYHIFKIKAPQKYVVKK